MIFLSLSTPFSSFGSATTVFENLEFHLDVKESVF